MGRDFPFLPPPHSLPASSFLVLGHAWPPRTLLAPPRLPPFPPQTLPSISSPTGSWPRSGGGYQGSRGCRSQERDRGARTPWGHGSGAVGPGSVAARRGVCGGAESRAVSHRQHRAGRRPRLPHGTTGAGPPPSTQAPSGVSPWGVPGGVSLVGCPQPTQGVNAAGRWGTGIGGGARLGDAGAPSAPITPPHAPMAPPRAPIGPLCIHKVPSAPVGIPLHPGPPQSTHGLPQPCTQNPLHAPMGLLCTHGLPCPALGPPCTHGPHLHAEVPLYIWVPPRTDSPFCWGRGGPQGTPRPGGAGGGESGRSHAPVSHHRGGTGRLQTKALSEDGAPPDPSGPLRASPAPSAPPGSP